MFSDREISISKKPQKGFLFMVLVRTIFDEKQIFSRKGKTRLPTNKGKILHVQLSPTDMLKKIPKITKYDTLTALICSTAHRISV
jgi:hypothetical protein